MSGIRIGIGYDIHRFSEGNGFILGGLEIPYVKKLAGHSDADVVIHAICDALLGACGKDDIGKHFPDTDERFRGVSSRHFLIQVVGMIAEEGWTIGNIDVTIVLEEPKLAPFKEKIRSSVADIAAVPSERVNIKAKTSDMSGPVGRGEVCCCQAVALVERCKEPGRDRAQGCSHRGEDS